MHREFLVNLIKVPFIFKLMCRFGFSKGIQDFLGLIRTHIIWLSETSTGKCLNYRDEVV